MNNTKNKLNINDIGTRIRLEREKLGLSREKFAELTGLSPFYIGQLERGERKMSLDTLDSISSSLNISTDYLLHGYTHYMENIFISEALDDINRESIDKEIKELIDILKGSSKEQIGLVKDLSKLILPCTKR